MKKILLFLCVSILVSCNKGKVQEQNLKVDVSDDIVIPAHYIVTKCSETLHIDGIANEPCWQNAEFSQSFIDIEGIDTPRYDTKMKMLWDEDFLYVYAQMIEPHIWGNLRQRDTVIYYNNDFEVFISPSGTTSNYGEIEINSLGTVWDLILDRPYRDHGKANNHWNLDELKSAVHIEGTLNDYSNIDSIWSVEMAIPMRAFRELGGAHPEEATQWRINFSRVEWDFDIVDGSYDRKKGSDGKYLPEYNWVWSPQKVINMHEPEKWGYLQFTTNSRSADLSFIEDEDMMAKQIAYALFRKTKFGSLQQLLEEEVGSVRSLDVRYADDSSIKCTFHKTHFGFEYKIDFRETKKSFLINESGRLNEIE